MVILQHGVRRGVRRAAFDPPPNPRTLTYLIATITNLAPACAGVLHLRRPRPMNCNAAARPSSSPAFVVEATSRRRVSAMTTPVVTCARRLEARRRGRLVSHAARPSASTFIVMRAGRW